MPFLQSNGPGTEKAVEAIVQSIFLLCSMAPSRTAAKVPISSSFVPLEGILKKCSSVSWSNVSLETKEYLIDVPPASTARIALFPIGASLSYRTNTL